MTRIATADEVIGSSLDRTDAGAKYVVAATSIAWRAGPSVWICIRSGAAITDQPIRTPTAIREGTKAPSETPRTTFRIAVAPSQIAARPSSEPPIVGRPSANANEPA